MLRHYSIVNPNRFATRDIELAGVTIKKADRIQLILALATHDPAEFEAPDVVDFARLHNRHIAFGAGPHRCVGSHLARAELVVALEELTQRLPGFKVATADELPGHAGPVFGLDRLPLEWDLVLRRGS
jgi:cytochrome P450